ncbi:MAG: hypothetical protein K6E85_02370, partial [Lachnospiraceae bacterium]|nr:hypothetical protein [Lachnospiraceae bacterium]
MSQGIWWLTCLMREEGKYHTRSFRAPLPAALFLYDGHAVSLWRKSTRSVVADEPQSDSQGLHREMWARRRDSEIVA